MKYLFEHLNLIAIFVASLSSFVIGAIWFGPKAFYPIWMKSLDRKVPTERIKMTVGETLLMFGGTYLAALIQVSTLALVISMAKALDAGFSAGTGALFGFVFSVGLGAFASLSHRIFAQPDGKVYRSIKVWIIEVGQDVVCLTLAGLILGTWN